MADLKAVVMKARCVRAAIMALKAIEAETSPGKIASIATTLYYAKVGEFPGPLGDEVSAALAADGLMRTL